MRKKLQSRNVEVAVQTEAFECLTKSSDNDGVRRTLLKVDNPISLGVLVSNNSSLLHDKIHNKNTSCSQNQLVTGFTKAQIA